MNEENQTNTQNPCSDNRSGSSDGSALGQSIRMFLGNGSPATVDDSFRSETAMHTYVLAEGWHYVEMFWHPPGLDGLNCAYLPFWVQCAPGAPWKITDIRWDSPFQNPQDIRVVKSRQSIRDLEPNPPVDISRQTGVTDLDLGQNDQDHAGGTRE